jgi:hypothetical protein
MENHRRFKTNDSYAQGEGGLMKSWGCTDLRFIRFPLMKASGVRRGSPGTRRVDAGVPDRRSPALIVGPGFTGVRALRAHSEGGRPSVGHLCGDPSGARRPAHNQRFLEAQQKLRVAKGSQEPFNTNLSSPQVRGERSPVGLNLG